MKIIAICAALATAALFVACGDDSGAKETDRFGYGTATAASISGGGRTPVATPSSAPAATPTAAQTSTTGGTKTYSAEPPMTIDPNKKYFAIIKMDIGDIKLELYPQDAPRHVNSFVFLAREGYYDGVTFHRVIPGFVAQGGDPTGTGRGGPGYTIPLEVSAARKHVDGALGMARTADPDSAGSQFFIDYGPLPALDPGANGAGYTVFGQVVEGRDVLDKITPRDPSNPADLAIVGTKINTIIIEEQ